MTCGKKMMWSKWLFLYNRVKVQAGYQEGMPHLPPDETPDTIINELIEAAEVLDQQRGEQSMHQFMTALKKQLIAGDEIL